MFFKNRKQKMVMEGLGQFFFFGSAKVNFVSFN